MKFENKKKRYIDFDLSVMQLKASYKRALSVFHSNLVSEAQDKTTEAIEPTETRTKYSLNDLQ